MYTKILYLFIQPFKNLSVFTTTYPDMILAQNP